MENGVLSIKNLIAVVSADIDTYLLKDETQTFDLDRVYTAEDIRNQLYSTNQRIIQALIDMGYDVDKPLKK